MFLSLPDPSDFRVGVNDSWDGAIVDMASLARNVLNASNTLFLSLMGQHGSLDDVSNGVDAWDVGLEVSIDFDSACLIQVDAEFLGSELLGEGSSSSGDQ